MTRIKHAFDHGKAFIAFLTAGDPSIEKTEELVLAMAASGADLVEIGIPFSDPVAEGEVIQRANERALGGGVTTDKIFAMVKNVRAKTQVPLVFLTYINPIFTYGVERFLSACAETGVDGLIIPDLPFEEKGEIAELAAQHGVDIVSLIAPTSAQRIGRIAKEAQGFVYCVSSLGVTGVRSEITTDLPSMIELIRENTQVPIAVGFGISTPAQAATISEFADGVIVGSAIVKLVEEHGDAAVGPVSEYVRGMKAAVGK